MVISLLGSTTIHSYICTPPSAPSITAPLNGSSVVVGSPFIVGGSGEPNASIILSDNGVDAITLQADETNRYYGSMTAMESGRHTISVRAVRPCGSAVGSSITVDAKADSKTPVVPVVPVDPSQPTPAALSLFIVSPKNGITTTESSVYIDGYTNMIATIVITVNGEIVGSTSIPRSFFGMNVPLEIGENTIAVSAVSTNGTASAAIKVIREKSIEKVAWYQAKLVRMVLVGIAGIGICIALIGTMKRYRRTE